MAFGRKKKSEGAEEKEARKGFAIPFGRNRDEEDEPVDEVVNEAPAKGAEKPDKRKKKRNEMLSSVLRESVWDTAISEMRANDKFSVYRDGQVYHVGLLLDVDDIGGLSKKTNRDEAKGGIIECINSGRIQVLITAALMLDELIIIIPTKDTLDAMDEFSLLRNAPYRTMFVATDGSNIDDEGGVDITLDDAKMIANGQMSISEFLSSRGCPWVEGASDMSRFGDGFADESFEVDEPASVTEDDMSAADRDLSHSGVNHIEFDDVDLDDDDDDVPDVTPSISGADAEEIMLDEVEADRDEVASRANGSSFVREDGIIDVDGMDSVMDVELPEEPEVVVDPVAFAEQARRRFFSGELALDIDYGAFDAQFSTASEFMPFDTNRPGEWLSDYLNELSREANSDLSAMHARNISRLRERYTRLVSSYIAKIEQELSLADGATNVYAQRYRALEVERRENLDGIDSRVAAMKAEMQEDYDDRRAHYAETASNRARDQFDQRYGRDLEQRKVRAEQTVRTDIMDQYHQDVRLVQDMRREEAARRMDYGVTAILAELSKQYSKMLEVESARYDEHRQALLDWLDENRKQDIAWTNAVTEEHRQTEKADAVRNELTDRLRQQQMDYDQRKSALEADMADMRLRNEAALQEMASKHELALADLRNDNQRLKDREGELLDRYSNLERDKQREYDRRLSELEDERKAADARYDQLLAQSKRANIVWVALAVVIAVATLCIGMVIGLHQSIDYSLSTVASMLNPDLWVGWF